MRATLRYVWLGLSVSLLAACAANPPRNPEDICAIFQERPDWYPAAAKAYRQWGAPVPVVMAIIRQESSFVEDARPPRVRFLGIPLWRPTSAYGYGQAKDETWDWYRANTGRSGADRDDFADAADFVGWYLHRSFLALGLSKTDAFNQYLAYHEGHNGFRRGSWRGKTWLLNAARSVDAAAARYRRQMSRCRNLWAGRRPG